jgi:hypothetical protein
MTRLVLVKAYIPHTLYKRLDDASRTTVRSKSLLIGAALSRHLKDLQKENTLTQQPLPGQLAFEREGVDASNQAQPY